MHAPRLIPEAAWLEQLSACVIVVIDGKLRYANASALCLLQAESPGEVIGHAATDFIHPLDVSRVLARIRRAESEAVTNPATEFRAYTCRRRLLVLAMTSTHFEHDGQAGVLATFLDMSERAAMETRLRETDENFQRMMNTMQDVFYRTDAQGVTRYVCPAVKNVLGYEAEDIIGLPAGAFYPDPSEREALIAAIRQHGQVHDFPGRMRRKDGAIIDISISTHALFDEQGQYAGVEGIWRDITERKRMERELERLATYDTLTGLLNRRCIIEQLEQALKRCTDGRAHKPLAVLLLDLDHFKRINDSHGHAVGDRVLRQFVDVVMAQKRGSEEFGRLGGEEFLLILRDADEDTAQQVGERIRQAVEDAIIALKPGVTMRLTVSIGLTQARSTDRSPSDVLERADHALYQAKHRGRNRVCA
uniref:Diguanylate cyclase n=1 Tax=mine drainage metagenome TaxID=410659 RepID=E6PV17_9ZZZZ